MSASADADLRRLAAGHGVQTGFVDSRGRRRTASREALAAVLQELGATSGGDALAGAGPGRLIPPVVVAQADAPANVEVACAPSSAARIGWSIVFEDGATSGSGVQISKCPAVGMAPGGRLRRRLALATLPPGYHRLRVDHAGAQAEALVISAPPLAFLPAGRQWGAFLPLYSVLARDSIGIGDLGDLKVLLDRVANRGGTLMGTLPLLATYLDRPLDPSPYMPVSRLFWNEIYLDVERVPELASCRAAQELMQNRAFRTAARRLNTAALVDYPRAMALKRRVLERLSACCYGSPQRRVQLERWVRSRHSARGYARFRAAVEQTGRGWPEWGAQPPGALPRGIDPVVERYHLYVQWLLDEQLGAIAARHKAGHPAGLYLDLPLGVHRGGFDTWAHRNLFVGGMSCGAPPDRLFTGGQNWGFPPPHPERIRDEGYSYFIAVIRNHMRYARAIRIDHVMGFHRLFWVPRGMPATEGVYIRYRPEEFYAVLALESQRHGCAVVGEDLGTVPQIVRTTMAQKGVLRMYTLPFELGSRTTAAPRNAAAAPVPRRSLACLNTHDMPLFAGWLRQQPQERRRLAAAVGAARGAHGRGLLRWALTWLARSRAALLMVSLEDLWLETEPQNVPGTTDREHPNWRRRARLRLDEIEALIEVDDNLQTIARLRAPRQRRPVAAVAAAGCTGAGVRL